MLIFANRAAGGEPPLAFSSGRGAPAGISLREPAALLSHVSFLHAAIRGFCGVTAPNR